MPRDLWQAAGFLLGMASMLWLSPLALRASPSLEAGNRDQLVIHEIAFLILYPRNSTAVHGNPLACQPTRKVLL